MTEDVNIATADTAVNTTIYSSSTSATALQKPVTFYPGPLRIQIKPGGTDNTIFAVLRKVPQGYSAPAITPTDGNTAFADVMNVLAYGVVRVAAGSSDPLNRIDMRRLRKSVSLARGDSIVLQIVPNVNSTNQTASTLFEYRTV
jgi:hypothetical protein